MRVKKISSLKIIIGSKININYNDWFNPNAKQSDIAIYVNRTLGTSKPVVEIPFETCPHCRYILGGFNIISNN